MVESKNNPLELFFCFVQVGCNPYTITVEQSYKRLNAEDGDDTGLYSSDPDCNPDEMQDIIKLVSWPVWIFLAYKDNSF